MRNSTLTAVLISLGTVVGTPPPATATTKAHAQRAPSAFVGRWSSARRDERVRIRRNGYGRLSLPHYSKTFMTFAHTRSYGRHHNARAVVTSLSRLRMLNLQVGDTIVLRWLPRHEYGRAFQIWKRGASDQSSVIFYADH